MKDNDNSKLHHGRKLKIAVSVFLAVLVVLVSMLGLFAACSNSENKDTENTKPVDTSINTEEDSLEDSFGVATESGEISEDSTESKAEESSEPEESSKVEENSKVEEDGDESSYEESNKSESSNNSSKNESSSTTSKPSTSGNSSTVSTPTTNESSNGGTSSKPSTSGNSSGTTSTPSTSGNSSGTTSTPSTSGNSSQATSGQTTTTKPSTVAVTSVSLSKSSVSLTVGQTTKLGVTVAPSNATNKNYSFSSSNTSVATVNSSGMITAKSAGTCTITVKSSNGKTDTCKVTVKAKEQSSSTTVSASKKPPANAPVVRDSYGNEVYECPEIVPIINRYRAELGLEPIVWFDEEAEYKFFYEDYDEWDIEFMKEYSPELFDENGNYTPDLTKSQGYMATRNAISYMINNHTIEHSRNTVDSAHIQVGGGSLYDPEAWVNAMKNHSGSWKSLMSSGRRSIYCCYGYAEGDYVVAVD